MAYPTISGPYGLRPINLIGGQVFAGATRQRRIVNSSASSIGFGDPVKFDTNGCVVVCTETLPPRPLVLLVCSWALRLFLQ